MKRVWVMRHGKAEPDEAAPADIDRPLARRGRKDATEVGQWLAGHGGPPGLIVCSPALRARETAQLVAAAAGYSGQIRQWAFLYPGDAPAAADALRQVAATVESVLVSGHNPFSEDLVALLASESGMRVRMPTAALALLEAEAASWTAIEPRSMALCALITPEALRA